MQTEQICLVFPPAGASVPPVPPLATSIIRTSTPTHSPSGRSNQN